ELCEEWEREEKQRMHPRIMVYALQKIGFKSYIALPVPLHIDRHIIERYNWCKECKDWSLKRNTIPKSGYFLHDGASVYTAKNVNRFLARKNIRVLLLPPKSPDLNPIENL
ncbi:14209_t:CDS:2, partial [Dentiscutata heterogama]